MRGSIARAAWLAIWLVAAVAALQAAHGEFEPELIGGEIKPTSGVAYATNECWKPFDAYNKACAADQLGCLHENPLNFENGYPLTEEMLRRSMPSYPLDEEKLRRAFDRAHSRGQLRVAVLGGSVTMGAQCVTPSGEKGIRCSWVSRIEEWLRKRFPKAEVTVSSRAVSACAATCQLATLFHNLPREDDIDIVIVDLSSNDGFLQEAQDKAPGLIFGTGVNALVLEEAEEVIVRHALRMDSAPAVIYLETFRYGREKEFWGVEDWHVGILRQYGVPTVSYRDAVWPVYEEMPSLDMMNKVYWEAPKDHTHPSWRSHQLYSDVLAHFLESRYVQWCDNAGRNQMTFLSPSDPPIFPGTSVIESAMCYGETPSAYINAEDSLFDWSCLTSPTGTGMGTGAAADNSSTSGQWARYEDRPDKPGIIGLGDPDFFKPLSMGASAVTGPPSEPPILITELECRSVGTKPEVLLTYLESYERVGAARIYSEVLPYRAQRAVNISTLVGSDAAAARVQLALRFGGQYTTVDALNTEGHDSPYDVASIDLPPGDAKADRQLYRIYIDLLGPRDAGVIAAYHNARGTEGEQGQGHEEPDLLAAVHSDVRMSWKFKILHLSCC